MNINLFNGWLRHEDENGFTSGQSDALYGTPQRTDMELNMPCGYRDNGAFTPEQWTELIAARLNAYNRGYSTVTLFTYQARDKKQATEQSRYLKANGYSVISVDKKHLITAATSKRIGPCDKLPYGCDLKA